MQIYRRCLWKPPFYGRIANRLLPINNDKDLCMSGRNRRYNSGKIGLLLLCVGCLLSGCKADKNVDETAFKEHQVNTSRVFLSVENTPFLGRPTDIKSVTDGLFIVDGGHNQIIKVDKDGELVFSFGKRGRGPGEFQSIAGFWPFEREYLVYDYNSFKFLTFNLRGELVEEETLQQNPVNPDSEFSIPITLNAVSAEILLIPTGGRQGSLFAIADRVSGSLTYAGSAVGDGNIKQEYDNEAVMQTYSRGEIPANFLNLVMLGSSDKEIYSLHQTTGILEKYTHQGVKVWEKQLNIPAQRDLIVQIARHNRGMGPDGIRKLFIYARAMDATKEGVFLLLNLPEGHPLTIAWIANDGNTIHLVEAEGITMNPHGFMEGFTVSPEGEHVYYLERSSGTIYQFDWPN